MPLTFDRFMITRSAAFAAAVVVMTGLVACRVSSPESLVASGKEFAAKKDYKSAILQYKSALQTEPRNANTRLLLGQALMAAGDPAGAAVELNKALDDKAPAVLVIPLLSKAMVAVGEYKKLVTLYGDLKLPEAHAQAALKVNLATAWGALGDRARTEAETTAAVAALPDFPPALVLKARLLAGGRQFDEASALVTRALEADPNSAEAWLLRGEILYFGKSDAAGAELAYRKALVAEPAYVPAHAAIISSRIRARDTEGAKLQAKALRAVLPNHPHTLLVDAQLAYLSDDPARARELLQRLLRSVPDHPGVLILAGAVEYGLGAVTQAASYFEKALQLYPGLEIARLNLAEVEIRLGQSAKALETLKPLLAAEPPRVDAVSLAGDAALRLGNAALAERFFVQAARLDPTNIRRQTAAALTRLWVGDGSAAVTELRALTEKSPDTYADEALFAAQMKRREFDGALAVLDGMAKKVPGKASIAELRGRVYVEKNDIPSARKAFEEALKLDSRLTAALIALAAIDMREGRPEQAMKRLQEGLTADPKNMVLLVNLAELQERQNQPLEAVRATLTSAIAASPNAPEPRLRLIAYAVRKRLYKEALAAAQEALVSMPGDAQILQAAGRAQLQGGDVEQAASTFRRLATVSTASPQPYVSLADVYRTAGDLDKAESALTKALEIDPSFVPARAALIDIFTRADRQKHAEEYIARLRSAKPKDPYTYVLDSGFRARQQDFEGAISALRQGLALSNSPDLAVRLYVALIQAKRGPEAARFGADWLRKHPNDLELEYAMSNADMNRGDFALAEQKLKRVVSGMPNNAAALNNLAWVVLNRKGEGAVVYARRALEIAPERTDFMDTLALALGAENQAAAAVAVQRKAVELAPADNRLRLTLARLAAQAGDKTLARQELTRLQSLGAAFQAQAEVAQLLQQL